MNNDLRKILQKLEKRGDNGGINITFDEKGISSVKGKDGYTPVKGVDYFTDKEIRQIISIVKEMATPVKGKDYYTSSEVAEMIRGVESRIRIPKDGKDGADGKDGMDGESPDPRTVAIDAINFLETFEGDARLSAKALRDLDEAVTEILKKGAEFTFTEKQINSIKDLLPKYPPMNAGGSGATFLKSLRDVDLSNLTKNADGKYVLGGGSGSSTFLDLTDTPSDYSGQAGKAVVVNGTGDGLAFTPLSGGGDMLAATYDPTSVAGDAFDMDNMVEGSTNLILTATEREKIGNGVMLEDTDLDTVTTGGRYGVIGAGNTNIPKAGEFALEVYNDGSRVFQLATYTDNSIHSRVYNGSWSAWTTQTAANISDFDTEVANNSAVAANTAKVSATTSNIQAAGALMDSEVTNLAQVKAFDSSDYATAAQGALADSAQQPPVEGAFVDGDKTKLDGIAAGAEVNTVDSVNSQTGVVVLDADDIDDTSTTNKFTTADDISKLAGIETSADVTDAGNVGSSIHGATAKTTPVDADTVPLIDSAASNVLKKVTWANIKATLKTYFDTLYYGSGDSPTFGVITYTQSTATPVSLGNLGATETIDWATATRFTGTLDSNVTITHSNEVSGRTITLYLAYDGTAQRTITWSGVDVWLDNNDGSAPVTPSASGEVLIVTMDYVGTTCYASATGNYAVYA